MVDQLLTSMDGMEALENVVVIGATNRPDILDRALLRAGRFDRLIQIPVPDNVARLKILKVHTKGMPLKDVSLEEIVSKTDGYVGADIEALCREAALISLREDMNAKTVTKKHFEKAIESVRASVTDETVKYYDRIAKELAGGIIKRKKEDMGIGYR
jgi:transitional endoplasmic reticulum ATPase